MSLSPARQHRLRVQAEQAAREGGSVRHASGYDLMLLQLAEDRRRLKGVQSTVKKAEIKVELLPKYAAWAEGVLAAGGAQQDDVLMYGCCGALMPEIMPGRWRSGVMPCVMAG